MSYQKFTKDIILLVITNLIFALRSLFILPLITKILGPESYGIWAQIIVIIPLLAYILTLGLPFALVRFLAAEKNKKEIQKNVYGVLISIFLGITIISFSLIIFSNPLSNITHLSKILIELIILILFCECLNLVFLNLFRAFQQIKKYSFFIIFQGLGEILLTAIMLISGWGLMGALFSLLIIRMINFFLASGIIIKEIGLGVPNFAKLLDYLRFSLPTIPGNISSWFVNFSDRFIISYFLGAVFVGYYVPAYTLGIIISFFETPLSFLLPPVLSKLYDEQKLDETKKYLKYSLKYLLLITVPALFGITILAKPLLITLSTPEIAQKGYLAVLFIAFAMMFSGIYTIISQILVLVKKTSILGNVWMIATILNIVLNIALIRPFGIIAAAVNLLITYIFIFLSVAYLTYKYFRFPVDWMSIQKSILAAFIMSLFLLWFKPFGLFRILLSIVAGVLIYGILIITLRSIEKKELIFLKSLFTFTNRT